MLLLKRNGKVVARHDSTDNIMSPSGHDSETRPERMCDSSPAAYAGFAPAEEVSKLSDGESEDPVLSMSPPPASQPKRTSPQMQQRHQATLSAGIKSTTSGTGDNVITPQVAAWNPIVVAADTSSQLLEKFMAWGRYTCEFIF